MTRSTEGVEFFDGLRPCDSCGALSRCAGVSLRRFSGADTHSKWVWLCSDCVEKMNNVFEEYVGKLGEEQDD
jgi:hypothetical protein